MAEVFITDRASVERCVTDVLELFKNLFTAMEDMGILDSISETDLWCLHFFFQKVIDDKLQEWVAAWIRHPLSTEHNLTPLQLWVQDNFENACFQQTVSNDYGIDWEGPVSVDNGYEDGIDVVTTNCLLNQTQLNDLQRMVDESDYTVPSATPWPSVRCYLLVIGLCKRLYSKQHLGTIYQMMTTDISTPLGLTIYILLLLCLYSFLRRSWQKLFPVLKWCRI